MLNIRCFLSCVQIFEHFLNTLRPHFCVALCHLAVGAKIALKRGKKNCKPLFRDLHFLCELFRSRIIKFYVIWLKNVVFRLFAHSFRPRPPFNPIFSFSLKTHNGSILIILNTRLAVEKVFEALKQCQPEHTQLYCLTTHLCAKHRADVIAEVKQKLNTLHGQERLICVSSQLIEAGVDVSFDCVIRSMAALPSVAQASGRCNRNAERKCRTVYLVKTYNLENLDRLPELRNGREATRHLLQQLQRDADLLEPESILRYYQLYYAESQQQERMGDPVELKGYIPPKTVNLFDLLSDNQESVLAWKETTGKQKFPNYLLRQAFATAERNFHALEDITTPVVVPYGEDGADMATRLSSSKPLTPKMLRDAQRFTVGITTNEKIRLADQGALYTVKEGAVTILNKEYYDDEKGIQTSPGFMPIQFA